MLPGAPAMNALTRRAGGARPKRPPAVRLVVDVREFMSPLPSVLHLQGLQIVPVTLEACPGHIRRHQTCCKRRTKPQVCTKRLRCGS